MTKSTSEQAKTTYNLWIFWTTVPMILNDEKKRSSFEYSESGYKHFHPWFLADLNPSSVDEYFQLVMEVLPHVDPILNREEYWFFRADINILMMWYRVSDKTIFGYFVVLL